MKVSWLCEINTLTFIFSTKENKSCWIRYNNKVNIQRTATVNFGEDWAFSNNYGSFNLLVGFVVAHWTCARASRHDVLQYCTILKQLIVNWRYSCHIYFMYNTYADGKIVSILCYIFVKNNCFHDSNFIWTW